MAKAGHKKRSTALILSLVRGGAPAVFQGASRFAMVRIKISNTRESRLIRS